ncbi:MAG: hypothetical protein AAF696_18640, partial [Bacteroidota bacterium]
MTEASISEKTYQVENKGREFVVNGKKLNPDLERTHPKLWHILHNNTSVKIFVNKVDTEKRL